MERLKLMRIDKMDEKISCGVCYDSIKFNVSSCYKNIVEYLEHFLRPIFIFTKKHKNYDFKVSINEVSEFYCGIIKTHKTRKIILRESNNSESRYVGECVELNNNLHIKVDDTIIVINYIEKNISIYGESIQQLQKYSRLIIRDVIQKTFENSGGVFFHAASVINPKTGKSIVLLGDKGAGKTTILLELLAKYKYEKHCLDRIFFKKNENIIDSYQWPTLFNVGIGSLSRYEDLKYLVPDKYNRDYCFNDFWQIEEKVTIEPKDLKYSFGKPIAEVEMLIFPYRDLKKPTRIRKLEKNEILSELEKSCFSPNDPNFIDWHKFVINDVGEILNNCKRVKELISKYIPSYSITWGNKIEMPFSKNGNGE